MREAALVAQRRAENDLADAVQAREDAVAEAEWLRIQLADSAAEAKARVREDRDQIAALRQELAREREDARTERDRSRAAHTETKGDS